MKSSKQLIPQIGLLFGLMFLFLEGGVWRVLAFIAVGLGLLWGLAYWLFEASRGEEELVLIHGKNIGPSLRRRPTRNRSGSD